MKKAELLSPAGSFKKLKYALLYGADAAYVGLKDYSLRAAGMPIDEIARCVEYAHKKRKKLYVAVNIFADSSDFEGLNKKAKELQDISPDAVIIADPGIFKLFKDKTDLRIHISTQANITNKAAALFWKELGASRITLARECSLDSIKEISSIDGLETEVFVHGAMCFSYSGRCFLSKYSDGRDANKGECAQPCRWDYRLTESQSGEVLNIKEDERGSYVLSSKDLMLLPHLKQLLETGISSLKIEGRMKSIHYVATVTKAYREALDSYYKKSSSFVVRKGWLQELEKISHRPYSSGFLNGEAQQVDGRDSYTKTTEFVGEVISSSEEKSEIAVKNKLSNGEELEVLTPHGDNLTWKINNITELGSNKALKTAHANYLVSADGKLQKNSLLRRNNA